MSPDRPAEANWAELRPLWEDGPGSEAKRHAVHRAVASQSMEFHHINTELGHIYTSGAVVDDGSPPCTTPDPVRAYRPSTRPGHPLPHAFVERDGVRLPIGDLARGGRFLLLAGEEGRAWVDAAHAVADETGLPILAATVGVLDGDYVDVRAAWTRNREITPAGAVLVRPDRYVAYRSLGAVDDPEAALREALSTVLAGDHSRFRDGDGEGTKVPSAPAGSAEHFG
jgi:2,4-dichlorophenol 6-monooxygenase